MSRPEIFEHYLGRTGAPFDLIARICRCSESTVRRWEKGDAVPDADELQALIEADGLPADFRKLLAESLFVNCVDIKVACADRGAAPAESPMRVTFDIDEEVTEIQKLLHEAMHPASAGRESISPCEGARIDPRMAKVEVKLGELKRAINSRRLKPAV